MSDVPTTGGLRIVRYSGTRSTTLGTKQGRDHQAVDELAPRGPQDRQHIAARRRDQQLHEPRAGGEPDRVEEVVADLDVVPRLGDVLPAHTCGKIRQRRADDVCVVVIAYFASQQHRPRANQQQHPAGSRAGLHRRADAGAAPVLDGDVAAAAVELGPLALADRRATVAGPGPAARASGACLRVPAATAVAAPDPSGGRREGQVVLFPLGDVPAGHDLLQPDVSLKYTGDRIARKARA